METVIEGYAWACGAILALFTVGGVSMGVLMLLGDYWNRWERRYTTLSGRLTDHVGRVRELAHRLRWSDNADECDITLENLHREINAIIDELNKIPTPEKETTT